MTEDQTNCCPSTSQSFSVNLLLKIVVIIAVLYLLVSFQFGILGMSKSSHPQPVIRHVKNLITTLSTERPAKLSTTLSTKRPTQLSTTGSTKSNTKWTTTKSMNQDLTAGNFKRKVIIFIGIFTAPKWMIRRNAIRRSWLKRCKEKGIPCLFFTDGQDMHGKKLEEKIYVPLKQEQSLHGDMILAESPGGINFALRYLWMLNWANARYQFEYFLRVDDDYFVCIDRLISELPHRSKEKLYWGHVHCSPPGGIRVDEGFVIVSNDLAQTFLREQNRTLMCHPYGDQAMIMWINNIPGVTYFGDRRVHHDVANKDQILTDHGDICEQFMAIHGSYPVEIERFWKHELNTKTKTHYTVPPVTYPCGTKDKTFNYRSFGGMYNAVPRPCREMPVWAIGAFYGGRSRPGAYDTFGR